MGMTVRTAEARALTIPKRWRQRFINLHKGLRDEKKILKLPKGLGTPLALVATDAHGEVERYLTGLERLPVPRYHVDLGDKLDRGPEPLAANQLLEITNPPAKRLIGNHDAMWVGAGLGIERLAIELVRWLMRYNEQDFLVKEMGISLKPLEEFAAKYFANARGHYKAEISTAMEAAATYLKIISEAPYRFPSHVETTLNDSDLRIRKALFHEDAYVHLTVGERDTFKRLTGNAKLDEKDAEFFYRLMGGLRELGPEEHAVVKHFTRAFQDSHAYFQLIECMVGDPAIWTKYTMREGAPYDMLFTHAGIPITAEGRLKEYNGLKGKEAFNAIENDYKLAITAWRWFVETGDRVLLEADAAVIDRLGELPWGAESPLYLRQMQTAARAVLEKASGLYEEPEGAFFTHWVGSEDKQFVHRVCREISTSFGLQSRHLIIVHGHKPDKKHGKFMVSAGGHDLNIDAGTAENYGGRGGFLLIGSNGLYQFNLHNHQFSPVEVNLEYFPE
jgi:fructose-1,6-bisphosphatase